MIILDLLFLVTIILARQVSSEDQLFDSQALEELVKMKWGTVESPKTIPTNHTDPVIAFYHIYTEGEYFKAIVSEQTSFMKHTDLYPILDKVYYSTIGHENIIQDPKFELLHHFGTTGQEIHTLGLLYRYCQRNPKSLVLYFHDKGSFHHSRPNEDYRKFLNCFVLNPNCYELLTSAEGKEYDTCGWRASPVPHPHYPGNFWWGKCSYIQTLIDPWVQLQNYTFIRLSSQLSPCVGAESRYFSETWVTSGPKIKPADCMNASMDTLYLFGYQFPGSPHYFCPQQDTKSMKEIFGSKCDFASTWKDGKYFKESFQRMKSLDQVQCRGSLDEELIKRSMIWYGQLPESYLEWVKDMKPDNITLIEKTIIRPSSERGVYLYKDNALHLFPDKDTFEALGFDFDNVKVISDYHKAQFVMGDPIPSIKK
jgi:hypothetical protein